MMSWISATALAFLFVLLASSVGISGEVVVPDAQATAPGNVALGVTYPFDADHFWRYQQVYEGSELGSGIIVITGIGFRANFAWTTTWSCDVTVTLSPTRRGPGTLSATFDENLGRRARTVFSGSVTAVLDPTRPPPFPPNPPIPSPFEMVIRLDRPFVFYAGGRQNLLMELLGGCTGDGANDPAWDVVQGSPVMASVLAAGEDNPEFEEYTSGHISSSGLVTQFITSPSE